MASRPSGKVSRTASDRPRPPRRQNRHHACIASLLSIHRDAKTFNPANSRFSRVVGLLTGGLRGIYGIDLLQFWHGRRGRVRAHQTQHHASIRSIHQRPSASAAFDLTPVAFSLQPFQQGRVCMSSFCRPSPCAVPGSAVPPGPAVFFILDPVRRYFVLHKLLPYLDAQLGRCLSALLRRCGGGRHPCIFCTYFFNTRYIEPHLKAPGGARRP